MVTRTHRHKHTQEENVNEGQVSLTLQSSQIPAAATNVPSLIHANDGELPDAAGGTEGGGHRGGCAHGKGVHGQVFAGLRTHAV